MALTVRSSMVSPSCRVASKRSDYALAGDGAIIREGADGARLEKDANPFPTLMGSPAGSDQAEQLRPTGLRACGRHDSKQGAAAPGAYFQ